MKAIFHAVAIALLVLATPTAFAQQSAKAASPAELDPQFAKMQEQMTKMQDEMSKIQKTQDPEERHLKDHWNSMQGMMSMMHGMMGGSMMSGHMMGGPMMGGHMMMWDNYQKLTPEQLKQRQYMMDRMVPMQQMMMDQMMQHQHSMMQPPAPPPAK